MMRALWTAATGMTGQQTNVDVIANNLSNVNTTAYKKSRVEFKDLVYGIGHAECVVALDASGNFFGVGEKGLLMILCDMQFPPHLLYENTFDSDAIQLV